MTNKWVRSSAYAYDYVVGVLTCYAYVMLMRALVRTSLNNYFIIVTPPLRYRNMKVKKKLENN